MEGFLQGYSFKYHSSMKKQERLRAEEKQCSVGPFRGSTVQQQQQQQQRGGLLLY